MQGELPHVLKLITRAIMTRIVRGLLDIDVVEALAEGTPTVGGALIKSSKIIF
jgi:hypothetical protein